MVVKARMVPAGPGGTRDGAIDDLFRSLNGSWGEGARVTPWRACGVQASGYVPPGDYRSFRVGNAAAAVEPIGGEGIGLALWAGATLGEMLTEGAAGGNAAELARAQRLFARAYRTRLRLRRPACRAAGEVLARPRVVRSVRRLVAARGLGLRVWWWGMGKTDRSVGRVGGVSDKRAGTKARPDPAL
jgi:flavin-dependent dehydrogenase